MFRLTVDHETNQVGLNDREPPDSTELHTAAESTSKKLFGRSAYICRNENCVQQAAKSNRLKLALEGRRIKGVEPKRRIVWPLEPQLIQLISSKCTEAAKTCQNTQR